MTHRPVAPSFSSVSVLEFLRYRPQSIYSGSLAPLRIGLGIFLHYGGTGAPVDLHDLQRQYTSAPPWAATIRAARGTPKFFPKKLHFSSKSDRFLLTLLAKVQPNDKSMSKNNECY